MGDSVHGHAKVVNGLSSMCHCILGDTPVSPSAITIPTYTE